jgi:RNA polymerase sigma-70 factor (ECF subfamily)
MIDPQLPGIEVVDRGRTPPAVRRRPSGPHDRPPPDEASVCEQRFAGLVTRYGDMVRCFLLGLARRAEVAEDLSQQLWLKLLEAFRAGRFLPTDDDAVRSYLFTAARNLFVDECVRRHAVARTSAHDPRALEILMVRQAMAGAGPDMLCDREQLRRAVCRAIEQLPLAQQAVIRLWVSGASIEAMVRATGAPRDTVLSRRKYALRRLKAALTEIAPAGAAAAGGPR